VVVRIEASALMSYLKAYVEGRLPIYSPPEGWFTPGGNGVGVVRAVGRDVWQVKPGQRVLISSHIVAEENVPEPAQFLLGITASGLAGKALQADWRDGTLAEYALVPKSSATPVHGFDGVDAARLSVLMRFAIPYGGLVRGRLAAGETLIVTGATGAYGSAAVILALALGAARVVAAGRNRETLDVLVMLNSLEIIGQFMYPRNAVLRLLELARSGLLDINAIETRCFSLEELPRAMEAAAKAGGLECVVVKPFGA
jgi:alcohol dehydrogenase